MEEPKTKDSNGTIPNQMDKLEEGLLLCKFGRFHIKLMLVTLTGMMACTMVPTTSSYIAPNAECDLDMNMMQKGILNAVPFVGQVGAALFTGFLTDAFGRKIWLVYGNLGIFLCTVFEAASQNYWMLMVGKLVEGIFLSLCFSTLGAMVSEFTHKGVRDKVMLLYSSFMSISLILAALVSWLFLTRTWDFVFFGIFKVHAWNIYLFANSIWSFLSAIFYYCLPESPKFLLSHGRESEALDVLRVIYNDNTGLPKESFPMTSLNETAQVIETNKISFKRQLRATICDVKDLFRQPLLVRLLLFCTTTFVCLLAYSALRLWYPQLSTIVENFNPNNDKHFCTIIDEYRQSLYPNVTMSEYAVEPIEICVPKLSGTQTYINGIIVGFASLVCVAISGCFVDCIGQKPLMFTCLILCGTCSVVLHWTSTSIQIAVLVSATIGLMQAAFSLQYSILVRVFPTSVRAMAISLVLMVGRIGSVVGNILFPVMLDIGCVVPFIVLSSVTFCTSLVVYFLPNPNKVNNGNDR